MPSLYANLLDPKAKQQATISGAPVKYEFKPQAEETPATEEKKPSDAALRFQPIKRPQVNQKSKPRPFPTSSSPADKTAVDRKPPPAVIPNASSIEQWTAEDEYGENPYAAEYLRQEEEKRKSRWASKKKKKKSKDGGRIVDWDQIYDPGYPIRLGDYKGSEEQAAADYEWKQLLHAHQFKRKASSHAPSDGDRNPKQLFAPPANYNFAPPKFDDEPVVASKVDSDDEDYAPPPPAAAQVSTYTEVDDPYLRRLQMGGMSQSAQSTSEIMHPAPGTSTSSVKTSETPVSRPGMISAAPVKYDLSKPKEPDDDAADQGGLGLGAATTDEPMEDAPTADQEEDEDAPRSNRPGQRGFAKRLLQKYGWQEGQGLGATGSGITTILRHQTEKRKKRPDAEGGGWATPATMGRIVGGKRQKNDDEDETQQWSIVAKLDGMLNGLDVDQEMSEGNLMQEIGDRMGKYGVVERLYIDRGKTGSEPVFVKFTSALSAFRAIQASNDKDFLDNGRTAKSGFYDSDKFEQGIYE